MTGADMRKTPVLGGCVRGVSGVAWSTLLALAYCTAAAAQPAPAPPAGGAVVTADAKAAPGSPAEAILPAGCSSCGAGGGWVGEQFSAGNTAGCNTCVPGRTNCCGGCCGEGLCGRL